MRRTLAVLALAACGEDPIVIVPIIDSPADVDSSVLAELTAIRLTVEHDDGQNVVNTTEFKRGKPVEVSGVEFADDLVMWIDGFNGAAPIGVGRTCPFAVQRNEVPTPHIFLSRAGKASQLDLLAKGRIGGAAVTSPDNSVLYLGGEGAATLERYDARTNTLGEVPDHAALDERTGAMIAMLGKDAPRPAILGGAIAGVAATDIEVIDATGRVERFRDARSEVAVSDGAAVTLPDGEILITGGRDATGTVLDAITIVSVVNTTDVLIDRLGDEVDPKPLSFAREGHVMTRIGQGKGTAILITGGNAGATAIAQSELFKPLGKSIERLDVRFDLKTPRTRHRAFVMADDSVLIVGGIDGAGNPVRTIERFSPIDGFTELDPGTFLDAPSIDFGATTLPDGRIMIAGGRDRLSETTGRIGIYFISLTDSGAILINPGDDLNVPRLNPQLVVLCDGTVLITGGTTDEIFAERFNPNTVEIEPR